MFWPLFKKPAKPRENLRAISVTNSNGITRVNLEALFQSEQFRRNSETLAKFVRRVVPAESGH